MPSRAGLVRPLVLATNGRIFLSRLVLHTWNGLVGPFQALHRHRDLVALLIKRDIVTHTSGTALGGLWMLAQPALQVLGFWFLLGFVLKVRFPGRVAFLDYFLVGMLPWLMTAEVLNRSLAVFREYGALYARAEFPLAILPPLPLFVSGGFFGLVLTIFVLLLHGPLAALMTPLVTFALLLWLLPLCYLLAVAGLFLRDFGQAFPFILTMAMYITPILYMPEMLPAGVREWLVLNPFADVMALVHGALQGMPVSLGQFLRPFGLWLMLLAPAWVLFHRAQPHMREAL